MDQWINGSMDYWINGLLDQWIKVLVPILLVPTLCVGTGAHGPKSFSFPRSAWERGAHGPK